MALEIAEQVVQYLASGTITNAVNVTPAASPARSGRTTACVATVVNAYPNPSVNPHADSAERWGKIAPLPSQS